jgi:tetratricopeptide (TPR) repeat protein
MGNERKKELIDLGADALAEALLDLAVHSDAAVELIERLLSTPDENIQRIRSKLSDLKGLDHFYSWREIAAFSRELGMLLQDIKASVADPVTGLAFVALFFEADEPIFEHCDDSGGNVGQVFSEDAKDLFVHYAAQCTNAQHVADLILRLNREDNYGVRQILIDCAGKVVPKATIREMIFSLQQAADKHDNIHEKRSALCRVESLARQIKDGPLFEKTRLASRGTLNARAYLDIAEVYLESGDVETAQDWLKKVDEKDLMNGARRDELLLTLYKKQGDPEKAADILLQRFKSFRSLDTLQEYLDVIGHDKRDAVVAAEVAEIQVTGTLCLSDAYFLISIGAIDGAEAYLLKHADQLDGGDYGELLDIVATLEAENRPVVVSLIYRSLLCSILERGYTKAYCHGADYLKKLDTLAPAIIDWGSNPDHQTFKGQIRQAHGRKHSFWSKYEP